MEFTGKRCFIVDTDKGKMQIYLDDRKLMCQTSSGQDMVAENIKDFDIACEPDGTIRLLCCSFDGHMLLYKYDWHSWSGKVIYDYSKDDAGISQINILAYKSEIHLVYLLSENKRSQAVFHHHWNGREWTNAVIATPEGIAIESIYMLYDGSNNPHIVMIGQRSQSYCILHTYLDGVRWKSVETLYSTRKHIDGVSICATYDIMHMIWHQYGDQNHEVMYGKITGNQWQQPMMLAECHSKVNGTAISIDNEEIIAQWMADENLHQYTSSDGIAWREDELICAKDDIIKCKYIKEKGVSRCNKIDAFTIRGEWCIIRCKKRRSEAMQREDAQTLVQQMALLVDLYTDIKGILLQMNADSYAGRTASLRDAQVRQKQVGLDINQLRQINEDIMKSSMHLQERNQLLERTNQALEQKVAEYERLLDSLKTENIALKKQILEQMKLKQA
ncbi:MAG: hypothetical protein PWP48_1511 [Clostridiales bacterium]|jgi:hypothetical protein|nr:hypothetical protein [Clostridiales bacterium]MDK2902694.1 hypothetical protein [Clostridiales bacterium]MDK2992278.1 hypothetical protein [Clostridiales bacterium]